jgi:hypothetical protein
MSSSSFRACQNSSRALFPEPFGKLGSTLRRFHPDALFDCSAGNMALAFRLASAAAAATRSYIYLSNCFPFDFPTQTAHSRCTSALHASALVPHMIFPFSTCATHDPNMGRVISRLYQIWDRNDRQECRATQATSLTATLASSTHTMAVPPAV